MNTYLEWEDGIKFQVRENRTAIVCGAADFGIMIYILVMRLLYPSERGGGALLYLPLFCMFLGGVACIMIYINRKLIVEEMNIYYVNWVGRKKQFTLDEIGYCQIGKNIDINQVVVYDLSGIKLCKLETGMHGLPEFYQYLFDNGIQVKRMKSKAEQSSAFLKIIDAFDRETAICEEQIRKCAENLYEEIELIIYDWESRNSHFEAVWEFGFAEYTAEDLEMNGPLYRCSSSVNETMKHLPESYECVLEFYLKKDNEYVVDKRGEAVSIILPYLSKTKSYRIGEGIRIRKTDEESLKEWLRWKLDSFSGELPKHKYHTEAFTLGHKLRVSAGIPEETLPHDEHKKTENLGL